MVFNAEQEIGLGTTNSISNIYKMSDSELWQLANQPSHSPPTRSHPYTPLIDCVHHSWTALYENQR